MEIEHRKPFDLAKNEAEDCASDKRKAFFLLETASQKARKHREAIAKAWDDLTGISRLILAWIEGSYTEVPWKTITLALGAIIYFVNPLDLIPDFLSGVGYIDDVSVIWFVARSIQQDLDKFRRWERSCRQTCPLQSGPT